MSDHPVGENSLPGRYVAGSRRKGIFTKSAVTSFSSGKRGYFILFQGRQCTSTEAPGAATCGVEPSRASKQDSIKIQIIKYGLPPWFRVTLCSVGHAPRGEPFLRLREESRRGGVGSWADGGRDK